MNDIIVDLSSKTLKTMGDIDRVAVDMRVTQQVRARRDEILDAIGDRTCEPTLEILNELAQLDAELGIEPLRFPELDEQIAVLRAELKEAEKEEYRQRIRAEIAAETDEIVRHCLEHSLALLDDPDWIGNS